MFRNLKRELMVACVCVMVSTIAQARVTRIVIDEVQPVVSNTPSTHNIAYEQLAGRAFGELDPALTQNAIIQDIELAKDSDGKVRYTASFVIYKPVNLKHASGSVSYTHLTLPTILLV